MASVFLSYDRDDSARARQFAQALEKAGHQVWWDLHVRGGTQFSKVIEEALKAADVVVVLWSAYAVESAWVRDEAAAGRDSGRLVPVTIDGTQAPLGFRQFQTIDLSRWKGRGTPAELRTLFGDVAATARSPEPAMTGEPAPKTPPVQQLHQRLPSRTWIAGLVIGIAIIVLGLTIFRLWEMARPSTTTVSVAAADDSSASRSLARDLVVKLGALQTGELGSVRLAAADERSANPDLLLEVGSVGAVNHTSLLLKDGRRGTVLWSREFEEPSQQLEDLKQQLAFTSARTLDCLLEERSSGVSLRPETSKSYLNACAQLSEIRNSDPSEGVRILSQVVQEQPRFKPAWARLLLAEAETTNLAFNEGRTPPGAMAAFRKHIDQARQLDPDMPEVTLAEASLVQPTDISRTMALIEPLASSHPDNPDVLDAYTGILGRIGRSGDSVAAASKAVRLDPLSPARRNNLISALAYSGAFEAATRELREAERLWPGTATVEDVKFRFHYRYGDPKIARDIFERQAKTGGTAVRLYLEARIDPSPANVQRLLTYARERLASMENPSAGVGTAAQAYAQFAGKEEVLNLLLRWPNTRDLGVLTEIYFRPHFRETRRDPRFMQLAKRAGLLTYWRKSGKWPDFCFEPDLPYDCKKEAARLGA